MRHPTRVAVVIAAATITLGAVGAGVASAQGPGEPVADGLYSVSSASSSQSMVEGSSPTSLGQSPLAKTPAGKAAAAATAADEQPGAVTSSAVAVLYNPKTGQVLARQRYGQRSEGTRIPALKPPLADHGTGGSSTAGGCERVTVTQKLHSLSGLSTVGTWKIWTDWCWTRSTQVVSKNDTGIEQGHDQVWSYDGVLTEFNENHYYDFSVNDNHPKSAYMFVRQAKFHGPCIDLDLTCQWTPKNSLASYYNGTWQWWTSS